MSCLWLLIEFLCEIFTVWSSVDVINIYCSIKSINKEEDYVEK